MPEKQKQKQENDFTYIAIYFLTFITGIIFILSAKAIKGRGNTPYRRLFLEQ